MSRRESRLTLMSNIKKCTFFNNRTFVQCRDLENHHHEKVLMIAVATLERVAKNELDEDLPDDVQLVSRKKTYSYECYQLQNNITSLERASGLIAQCCRLALCGQRHNDQCCQCVTWRTPAEDRQQRGWTPDTDPQLEECTNKVGRRESENYY